MYFKSGLALATFGSLVASSPLMSELSQSSATTATGFSTQTAKQSSVSNSATATVQATAATGSGTASSMAEPTNSATGTSSVAKALAVASNCSYVDELQTGYPKLLSSASGNVDISTYDKRNTGWITYGESEVGKRMIRTVTSINMRDSILLAAVSDYGMIASRLFGQLDLGGSSISNADTVAPDALNATLQKVKEEWGPIKAKGNFENASVVLMFPQALFLDNSNSSVAGASGMKFRRQASFDAYPSAIAEQLADWASDVTGMEIDYIYNEAYRPASSTSDTRGTFVMAYDNDHCKTYTWSQAAGKWDNNTSSAGGSGSKLEYATNMYAGNIWVEGLTMNLDVPFLYEGMCYDYERDEVQKPGDHDCDFYHKEPSKFSNEYFANGGSASGSMMSQGGTQSAATHMPTGTTTSINTVVATAASAPSSGVQPNLDGTDGDTTEGNDNGSDVGSASVTGAAPQPTVKNNQ